MVACHALSMGIKDDAIIAACLLHDVVEDCDKNVLELPVNDECRELVVLLTHGDTTDENREQKMNEYFEAIGQNTKASLVKCINRCNNLTTMSWGLSRENLSYDKRNRRIFSEVIEGY